MLFFALLPTDLQVYILQSWIGAKLSALSALDIAVCSQTWRPDLISCMTAACRHWGQGIGKYRDHTCYDVLPCANWMASRGLIPVKLEPIQARGRCFGESLSVPNAEGNQQ